MIICCNYTTNNRIEYTKMAEFYQPMNMTVSGNNFLPMNKNMESLFLSKITNFITEGLLFVKNNHEYFHYDVENFVYKICYVSSYGNFCIIYITIFTENSLYYYEFNRRSGDSIACLEFMKMFEKRILPDIPNIPNISNISNIPNISTSDNDEQLILSMNGMISSEFADVKKQGLIGLLFLSKKNPESLVGYINFYEDLFEQEDDWENTFTVINILKNIESSEENSKNQIEKCLKKLKDISISSNIRKNIVEKSINNFINSRLKKYTYTKDFLEKLEKETEKIKNINNHVNFTNIHEILEIPELL
jgi:hypothetical protein